jgi:hypothetical protein
VTLAFVLIVRGADFCDHLGITPESAGLPATSDGFPLATKDDHETVEKASFLYDALYPPSASAAEPLAFLPVEWH